MKKLILTIAVIGIFGCSKTLEEPIQKKENTENKEPHNYGGWYCPDNLNGFPPVNIKNWKNVPVIEGRLPTKEETKSEASLIFVDTEKYPNAKPINISLPKLATYYTEPVQKEEIVIIIQAFTIDGDSIVGFRYLNGGNGSARYKEVKFIEDDYSTEIPSSQFVSLDIKINADAEKIWEVITKPNYTEILQMIFDKENKLKSNWKKNSNVNFVYASNESSTSTFADKLYGCFYVQNDYQFFGKSYVDKFLLLENKEQNFTELKIVCGPYLNDFEAQQIILEEWAEKVKELSENQ